MLSDKLCETVSLAVVLIFFLNYMARMSMHTSCHSHLYVAIPGAVTWYAILQICVWWVCHVGTIFATVQFPIVAHSIQKSKITNILHITMVIAALLIPLGTPIAAIPTGKFSNLRIIPPVCSPRNANVAYYGTVLPMGIVLAVGVPMLISTIWILFKVNVL